MIRIGPGTMSRGRQCLAPRMLGVAVIVVLGGCDSGPYFPQPDFDRPSTAGFAADPERSDAPGRTDRVASSRPPGQDATVVRSMDEQPVEGPGPEPPQARRPGATSPAEEPRPGGTDRPPDRGAVAIIDAIAATVTELRQGEDGVSRISVTTLRNQSRSTREEFHTMRTGLMEVLTAAGRERRIVFTDAQELPVQYHLEGAAYRLNDRRQEKWELFLHLRQDDDGLLIWEPLAPVRVGMEVDGRARILEER